MTYKILLTLITLTPVIVQPRSASPTPANSPAFLMLPASAMPSLLNLLLGPEGRSILNASKSEGQGFLSQPAAMKARASEKSQKAQSANCHMYPDPEKK